MPANLIEEDKELKKILLLKIIRIYFRIPTLTS